MPFGSFPLSSTEDGIRVKANTGFSLMAIEFQFTATPELGNKALRYLLWRRGGPLGPILIILLPIVVAVMATDASMRPIAYVAGGAAIMLFLIFLFAVAHRRRIRRRFFKLT